MCIIIERNAGFEIPYEKFEAAVITNPHGYGLTYVDGQGNLKTFRSHEEPDAEKLYRVVNEELIDTKLLLHLRYNTVGATSLRNAHPFPILEKDKDGIDLRMAHNGTIYDYKPKSGSESDTRNFVKTFVRPFFKRMTKAMEPEELMSDEFIKSHLSHLIPNTSVLSFLDSTGKTMTIHETGNGGKREDDWYYSNTYSFNPTHRTPAKKSYNTGYGGYGGHNWNDTDWYNPQAKMEGKEDITYFEDTKVEKFTKKNNLEVEDLLMFPDEAIDLVVTDVENTKLLIKELLLLHSEAHYTVKGQERTIKSLSDKVKKMEKEYA